MSRKRNFQSLLPAILFILLFGGTPDYQVAGQLYTPPDTLRPGRLKGVVMSQSLIYASTLTGLYSLWYKDYPQSHFHFFNDNNEWLWMDKLGHATTSYYISKIGYNTYRWSGLSEQKSIIYGGTLGFLYQTTIEVLDGFSKEWGASPGDLAANTFGSAIFIAQQLGWHEQKVLLKWSFHLSEYAQYRPDVLGSSWSERMLKDYNGQTYWLSANIRSLLPQAPQWIPSWLNLAVGYGGDGMTGGTANPEEYKGHPLPRYKRSSQVYLSLDIDLTRIKTKSRALNLLLDTFGFIKIPCPTLELNKNGAHWHALYY